ncbi:hypothetical protein [Tsukamurella sp. USMM236]|uniref:hypothetical protein n=1 Tax=Tsukamurella sp. USMM236 TaxID=3081301 RepID=UPI00301671AE
MNYPNQRGPQFPPGQPPQSPQQPGRNKNIVVLLGGAVALLLVLVLVLVIAMVAKDDTPESTGAGVATTGVPTSGAATSKARTPQEAGITISNRKHLTQAMFRREGDTKTGLKLVITRSVELPKLAAMVAADPHVMSYPGEGTIVQFTSKDACVHYTDGVYGHPEEGSALVSQDLTVRVVETCTDRRQMQDTAQAGSGYFNVEVGSEKVPDVAKGGQDNKIAMVSVVGDAWDPLKAWGLMQGSPRFYEMKLEWA